MVLWAPTRLQSDRSNVNTGAAAARTGRWDPEPVTTAQPGRKPDFCDFALQDLRCPSPSEAACGERAPAA